MGEDKREEIVEALAFIIELDDERPRELVGFNDDVHGDSNVEGWGIPRSDGARETQVLHFFEFIDFFLHIAQDGVDAAFVDLFGVFLLVCLG